MPARSVDALIAHSRQILIGAVVIGLIAAAVGYPIERVLVPSQQDFSDPHSESGQVEAIMAATAHTGPPGAAIAVVRLHGATQPGGRGRQRIMQISRTISANPGVASVYSPLSVGGERLISSDQRYAGMVITLRAMSSAAIQQTLGDLQKQFSHQTDVLLGGTELAYKQASDQGKRDLVTSELLAFPLLFIAAILIFRGLIAALLPLVTGAFAIVITLAAMRLVNDVLPLSNFALNLVTGLTLALTIDYSLFIISRFREGLAANQSVEHSVRIALATSGKTVVVSALTIAGTLVSLLIFPQRFLYSMGVCGILVAICAGLTAITLLPAILMIIGHRVNALPIPPRRLPRGVGTNDSSGSAWEHIGIWVTRRPLRAALIGATVLVLSALPTLHIRFAAFNAAMLPQATSARQADDVVKAHLPNFGSLVTVTVKAPPSSQNQITHLLLKLTNLPGAMGAELPRYRGHSLWVIELEGQAPEDTGSTRTLVRDARRLNTTSLPLKVGGVTATSVDKLESLQGHLPLALAIIAISTLVSVFALTCAVLLPVKALIVNLLTICGAFGLLVLIFQDGYLHRFLGFSTQPGLEATQPVLLFALAFGLSTDYGIFLLARITEGHTQGLSTRDATVAGLRRTGGLISAAALLFCIAIGALASSPLVLVKMLGLGAAFAVLLDATFARALLVPSLIVIFGDFNWWAPSPLRKLHRKIGFIVEGATRDFKSDERPMAGMNSK